MAKQYLTAEDACALADEALEKDNRNLEKVLEQVKIAANNKQKQVLIDIALLDANTKAKLKALNYTFGNTVSGDDHIVPTRQWVQFFNKL